MFLFTLLVIYILLKEITTLWWICFSPLVQLIILYLALYCAIGQDSASMAMARNVLNANYRFFPLTEAFPVLINLLAILAVLPCITVSL